MLFDNESQRNSKKRSEDYFFRLRIIKSKSGNLKQRKETNSDPEIHVEACFTMI